MVTAAKRAAKRPLKNPDAKVVRMVADFGVPVSMLGPAVDRTRGACDDRIDGKEIEYATDVKAYDKLQVPAIKKKVDARSKSKAGKSCDDDERKAGAKKKLTPAQQKEANKLKDEQLAARIRGWRNTWLKTLVAGHMADVDASPVLDKFVTALVLTNGGSIGRELADAFAEALPKGIGFDYGDLGEGWDRAKKMDAAGDDGIHYEVLTKAICTVLAEEDRDPRHPKIPFELIDGMAAELGIDLAKAWDFDFTHEATQFETLLLLHTGAQLDELNATEKWGVYLTGKGRTDKISILKASARSFELPKCVAPVAAAAGGKRKRGKR